MKRREHESKDDYGNRIDRVHDAAVVIGVVVIFIIFLSWLILGMISLN